MNPETIALISSLMGAAAAALTTLFIWLFRAREADINLRNALLMLEREMLDVREDVRENRRDRKYVEQVLFRLINYLNNKHKLEIPFFEVKVDE